MKRTLLGILLIIAMMGLMQLLSPAAAPAFAQSGGNDARAMANNTGAIGDFVWLDMDGDGVQDAGETGIAGMTVHLLDGTGTQLASTQTDANGYYQFDHLSAGDYAVAFVLPGGYAFSPQDQGGDDAVDSDADPSTGQTPTLSLSDGESNQTLDAGVRYLRAEENFCYAASDSDDELVSINADGSSFQDIGSLNVSYIEAIALNLDGSALYGADADELGTIDVNTGDFSSIGYFGGGDGEDGWVDFDDVDSLSFDPVTGVLYGVTRRNDGSPNDALFQINPATGAHVPDAFGSGVDYVIVDSGSAVGLYDIDDIAVDPGGQMYGIANSSGGGDHLVKIDKFTGVVTDVGRLTNNGEGLDDMEGLTAFGTDALYGVTGASGNESNSIWRIDKATGQATKITTFPEFSDYEAIACKYMPPPSLGGRVWHDLYHDENHKVDGLQDGDEPSLENVTVQLYDANDNLVATTTTDANGDYLFTDLNPGDYRVKIADGNFDVNGPLDESDAAVDWHAALQDEGSDDAIDSDGDRSSHDVTVSLSAGEDKRHVDFGFFQSCVELTKTGPDTVLAGDTFDFHFEVYNCGDVVLHGGVTVYDALLNPDGDHAIWNDVVYPGETKEFDEAYTASEDECPSLTNDATAEGHPQMPDGSYLANVTDEDSWTVQVNCVASLGDFVWHDLNANGVQDAGEPGIDGVSVELFKADGTSMGATQTASGGAYSFDNLAPDDYYVQFTLPSGYVFSPQNQGNDDAMDSDADPSTGKTAVITLASGENDLTWDAGMYQRASLGDYVWWDINQDGIQDADENGISDVTVTLKDANGNTVGTTTTDADGAYSFDNLAPGDYTVVFTTPSNDWSISPKDQGGDDAVDSDADPGNGETGIITLSSGETDNSIDAGMSIPASYTITKENTTAESDVAPGDAISFTITIENTGATALTAIPVRDTYDIDYLSYVSANVAPEDATDDGQIDWNDLTQSFGADLEPGQSFSVVVNFTAAASTEQLSDHQTINTATAHDVQSDPDGAKGATNASPLPDQSDDAPANILNPVGEDMHGFDVLPAGNAVRLRWQTASESDILGFNILRSSGDGQFEQINESMLFARHAGADMAAEYRFEDRAVFDGSFAYILEIIHLDGSAERYGYARIEMTDRY